MRLQLVGITDAGTAKNVELYLADPDLAGIILVEACGLAAIVMKAARNGWLRANSRKKLIERLSTEQRRLEALIKLGPLLPAAGDARFDGLADVSAFLAEAADGLKQELDAHGSLVQFQVVIAWDAERREAGLAPPAPASRPPGSDPVPSTCTSRQQLADKAEAWLKQLSRGHLKMPCDSDSVLLNSVVMIDKADESKLDAVLARIDAIDPVALTLRVTGPLPPLSFACVAVDSPSDPSIRAARRLLGINAEATAEAVRLAYLRQAKALHPDMAGASTPQPGAPDMSEIKTAYDLLRRVHAMRSRNGGPTPLASIRREGDVARAI